MNYLLISLIPFRRSSEGEALVDGLWAEDLRGLCNAVGSVTVAAPEIMQSEASHKSWGIGVVALKESNGVRFVGLPTFRNRIESWRGALKLRSILSAEVAKADLVHSSNYFPPYLGLAYAHQLAVRKGKKTLFVVAEDFYDFMEWSYAESGVSGLRKMRSMRLLDKQERLVRQCLSSASISFLHTPAAMRRYRLVAPRGMAIRQPIHEIADVVTEATLTDRALRASNSESIRLVVAARLVALKGIDFLLRAIQLLRTQQVLVSVDIYGAGHQKIELIDLAKALGLESQVIFHEGIPYGPEFRQALERCDIAIMPHLTNDFGRAFWDAMAAGLPVIAFHSEAASWTVRDHVDGLLAPMADVEGLAERIREVYNDRPLLRAMSLAARARALTNTRSIWNGIRMARIKELMQIPVE